jgi:zinc transporter ZupT
MEQEQESAVVEQKKESGGKLGLSIILGAVLGYLIGKVVLDKPALGTALGVVLGFVTSSSGEEEE